MEIIIREELYFTMETTAKNDSILKHWKMLLAVEVCCMISDWIGDITIPLGGSISITLLPLIYCIILVSILFLIKPFTWVSEKDSECASSLMSCCFMLLGASLGIALVIYWDAIVSVSIPLMLQNLGDALTCVVALPVGVCLFKMGRETVGLTFANSRESGIALIEGQYGTESAEFRGVLSMYVVGTLFGTIVISFLTSLFGSSGIFHPYAIAMAGGVGSTAMSGAAMGTMATLWPQDSELLNSMCIISNMISAVITVYLSLFVALPLANGMYKVLTKRRAKKAEATEKTEKAEKAE